MSSNDHKTFLTLELNKLLEEIDKLPLVKYGLDNHNYPQYLRNFNLDSDFVYKIQLMLTFDVFTMKQVKI